MTTPRESGKQPASSPEASAKADPIDLDVLIERLRNWLPWEKVGYTRDLVNKTTIAEIEALRERVAEGVKHRNAARAHAAAMDADVEAAEARVAELEGIVGHLNEANDEWYARVDKLAGALSDLVRLWGRGRKSSEVFEDITEWFKAETGLMHPGKDAPALGSYPEFEERFNALERWITSKHDNARAAAHNAGTSAEYMGYGGQAAMEALPELLRVAAYAQKVLKAHNSCKVHNLEMAKAEMGLTNALGNILHLSKAHGWCPTLEGNHLVCIGDWIITDDEGEHYPCKPGIFDDTYEVVEAHVPAPRGKFTKGPWVKDEWGNVKDPGGNYVRFENLETTTNVVARLSEVKANTALVIAAGTAATAAEDMGYDGQAAMEALPELLSRLSDLTSVLENLDGGYIAPNDIDNTDTHSARTLLNACHVKKSET